MVNFFVDCVLLSLASLGVWFFFFGGPVNKSILLSKFVYIFMGYEMIPSISLATICPHKKLQYHGPYCLCCVLHPSDAFVMQLKVCTS